MRSGFFAAFVLGIALVLAPGFSRADEGTSLEQLVVEGAQSKAQHEALAQHYEEQASAARKLANRHESTGRAYLGGKGGNKQLFQNHCKRIAEQQRAMAEEYDALAKLHREQAAQAN
jgi:hypothetical protein